MKLFTIVTVTWNAAEVIGPTLQSVRQQTCRDYEYLVVDGASKDRTLDLVREANYLIWLNAGDRFAAPDSLARLAAHAEGSPGVIYGQTQLVDATGAVVGMRHLTAPAQLTADSFKQGMLVCHQAFVARRDLMPQYDLQYRFSADYDWCVRVLKASERNEYVGDEPIISFLTDGLTDKYHKKSLLERFRIMCHHYGTLPTIIRHLGFLPRYLKRRIGP